MPPPAQFPAIAPDGTPGYVDSAKLQDAVNSGYRPGLAMRSPDGTKGIVAFTDMQQARANGYKTEGEFSHPFPPAPQNTDPGILSSSLRFLKSAGSTIAGAGSGLYHTLTDAPQGTRETAASNLGPQGLIAYRMGLKPQIDTAQQAVQNLKSGNTTQGVAGLAASALPMAGPVAAQIGTQMGNQMGEGNYAGAVGTGVTSAALALLLKKLPEIADAIPSSARAGAKLNDIQTQMGSTPINLSQSTIDALEQAQKLSDAGHGTVTPLDSLYKRINQITPMDFEEARMRQSALSRLTGQDQMTASNWLKGQAKQVSGGLGSDLTDQVQQAIGRGDDFSQGMKEYRQAQQVKQALKTTGKYAIGAGGLGGIVRYLHEASK